MYGRRYYQVFTKSGHSSAMDTSKLQQPKTRLSQVFLANFLTYTEGNFDEAIPEHSLFVCFRF